MFISPSWYGKVYEKSNIVREEGKNATNYEDPILQPRVVSFIQIEGLDTVKFQQDNASTLPSTQELRNKLKKVSIHGSVAYHFH